MSTASRASAVAISRVAMPHDEDAATLENACDVFAIVNAMLAAKSHDPRRTAAGLLTVIEILFADEDVISRMALAGLLCEAAGKLLSGAELEQSKDVADQVRWWH